MPPGRKIARASMAVPGTSLGLVLGYSSLGLWGTARPRAPRPEAFFLFNKQINVPLFDCKAALLTDVEKERAQNIMRLNQRLQQLGVKRLAQIVHQSNARKKSKNRDDHGQRVARGASSKRVLAPDHLEQTRCTRQSLAREKAAAALIPVEATEVPPPDSTSIQNEEGTDIAEEGKCFNYLFQCQFV